MYHASPTDARGPSLSTPAGTALGGIIWPPYPSRADMKLGIGLPTSHQGVYLPSPFAGPEDLSAIVRMAEGFGIHSAWSLDFMNPVYERHRPPHPAPEWYEAMTGLAFLAGVTSRIRLGTACIQLPLRDPFLLARQAATLDALSGGRCLLGVGLGQAREEFVGLRPRDRAMRRGALMEESLEALWRFFREGSVTMQGRYYQCQDLSLTPRPVQNPLPLYLAGRTEDTPRRVARWGLGWLLSRMQAQSIPARIASLQPHVAAAGRRREDIDIVVTKGLSLGRTQEDARARFDRSLLPARMDEVGAESGIAGQPSASEDEVYAQNLIGTPDDVAEQLDRLRGQGADHCVIFYFAVHGARDLLDQLQWFGEEVLPQLEPGLPPRHPEDSLEWTARLPGARSIRP